MLMLFRLFNFTRIVFCRSQTPCLGGINGLLRSYFAVASHCARRGKTFTWSGMNSLDMFQRCADVLKRSSDVLKILLGVDFSRSVKGISTFREQNEIFQSRFSIRLKVLSNSYFGTLV